MNGAFLHLSINHLPVIGAPVALLLLAAGLLRKSRDLIQAGFIALVVVGAVFYPVMRTGGKAAGLVHNLPGIEGKQIHEHAEAADDYGLWPAIILGVLSLVGLWKSNQSFPTSLVAIALIGALYLSAVMARVAHLGGLIRHPEIESTFVSPAPPK